jgi:hypothetical protein
MLRVDRRSRASHQEKGMAASFADPLEAHLFREHFSHLPFVLWPVQRVDETHALPGALHE